MENLGNNPQNLDYLGLSKCGKLNWNLLPEELIEKTVCEGQGKLASNGALCINTGEFTGRSPKDRFIVKDEITADNVWWGDINKPFDSAKFDQLDQKICDYLEGKEIFVKDAAACANDQYQLKVRVVSEYPWSSMFADNMFLRFRGQELENFSPDWHVICAPGFMANPEVDGTRQHNFAIVNFSKKKIIIGGTGYTGEIKKGIFSVLNFVLPFERNVLSMHCSANVGIQGDTAIFFGLSGTGKTTLSSDPNRKLIGDDEHGWAGNKVFNFEGGCYAKTIDLTREQEPQIFDAIKHGAILENIGFKQGTMDPDYSDVSITQNTRVSYPIHHIDNIMVPSQGENPRNIFFLTCDAFGVLPPISKLTKAQAMYHFISGYTAKVAGTEAGITEPVTAFSACFGAPFLPLHPTKYAEMLGEKMDEHGVAVWLVNTGWSGGPYGIGSRLKLSWTRSMITAALEGHLNKVQYQNHEIFGLAMPVECPNVPAEILNPKNTWTNKEDYDKKANDLADKFVKNFEDFASLASSEILSAAPKVSASV
ncbi:MAG: phosphoenolpyruvate carboxykinase (ATP) [Bacteroidota bacterium]